jgi:hypothetical protein
MKRDNATSPVATLAPVPLVTELAGIPSSTVFGSGGSIVQQLPEVVEEEDHDGIPRNKA